MLPTPGVSAAGGGGALEHPASSAAKGMTPKRDFMSTKPSFPPTPANKIKRTRRAAPEVSRIFGPPFTVPTTDSVVRPALFRWRT